MGDVYELLIVIPFGYTYTEYYKYAFDGEE